jgi:DNA-binding CsgD family transcriptional regulator
VGRQQELELLLDAAARAPADGLSAVLISGEAGIGKSTLLQAAGEALTERGWRLWRMNADALQRRIPYAAITDALRSLPETDSSYTAGLLSDVRAIFEQPDEQDLWFGQACEVTTQLLSALTAAGPVAIAVDDIDQLDDDSMAMLTLCLRRLTAAPIALLATFRPGPEPMIEMLEANAEITRLQLGPPPADDLGAIISPVLGAAPDPLLSKEIHARADGNPFFATELARSLVEIGGIVIVDGVASLTTAVRLTRHDALLRRVAPLAVDARTVAEAIAVFRRVRLDQLDLLAQVTSLPLTSVAEAFDDLLRRGLIALTESRSYRFTHAIVSEALYAEAGPALRLRLHARIATAMQADRDRGLPVDLLELAWHLSESARPGDLAAVVVITEAAQSARASAPERAVELCERALELLPAGSALGPGIQSIRCRALARASRPAEAVQAGLLAMAGLPAGPDRMHTATALVGSMISTGKNTEAIAVVDAEISAGDTRLRGSRALLLALAERDSEALAEAELAQASVPDTAAEQVQMFCQLTILTSLTHRHGQTAACADRALAAAGSSKTLRLQALAVGASTSALSALVRDASVRIRMASDLRSGLFNTELSIAEIALDWLRGRWESALRGLAMFTADQYAMLSGAAQAIELDIRSWRGELDRATQLAEQPPPRTRNMAALHNLALANYWIARGDVSAVERLIAPVLANLAALPYACVLLGRLIDLRPETGGQLLATLTEVAAGRFTPWSKVALLRANGLVHNDLDALRAAVTEAEAAELVFERARVVLELGLRTQNATEELVEAYQAFATMGADGLRRTAGRRLRELGAKVPRARSRTGGLLTETEEKIARLVRQGMRNREIGAALNYSPRSVEVYLSRIYAKLKISSRLELARVLDQIS